MQAGTHRSYGGKLRNKVTTSVREIRRWRQLGEGEGANIILWHRIPAGVTRQNYSIRFPWRWRKSQSFWDEANVSWRLCSIQYLVTITANPINPNGKSLIDRTLSHKVYLPIPNFPFWYFITLKVPNNGSSLLQPCRTQSRIKNGRLKFLATWR